MTRNATKRTIEKRKEMACKLIYQYVNAIISKLYQNCHYIKIVIISKLLTYCGF